MDRTTVIPILVLLWCTSFLSLIEVSSWLQIKQLWHLFYLFCVFISVIFLLSLLCIFLLLQLVLRLFCPSTPFPPQSRREYGRLKDFTLAYFDFLFSSDPCSVAASFLADSRSWVCRRSWKRVCLGPSVLCRARGSCSFESLGLCLCREELNQ